MARQLKGAALTDIKVPVRAAAPHRMEGEHGMKVRDLKVSDVGRLVKIHDQGVEVTGRLQGLEVKLTGTSRVGSLQGGVMRELHHYEVTATICRHIIALEGDESVEIINVNGMEGAA